MMTYHFANRREAGQGHAKAMLIYAERDDVIVLALPRGGVPVGFEVAKTLHAPLDVMLVRKLGVPGQEELALGALALPDICVFNHDVIANTAVDQGTIDRIIAKEKKELERRNHIYRGSEPAPNLKDRIVILVDDGMATGANMRAAVSAVAQRQPARIIIAVPVASQQASSDLENLADEVVCLQTPPAFFGVGQMYMDFSQTRDEEVLELLQQARYWGHGKIHFDDKSKANRRHA